MFDILFITVSFNGQLSVDYTSLRKGSQGELRACTDDIQF